MRSTLKKSQGLRGIRDDIVAFRNVHMSNQKKSIAKYLAEAKVPALHLGANKTRLPGWLETDIEPELGETVYLDASQPFPAPDQSFQYVYAEHMVEHIPFEAGAIMLRECRRVLKPGGVLRLTTPDLAFILGLYDKPTADGTAYVKWIGETFLNDALPVTPAVVINNAFRAWGHQFLYDVPTLEKALRDAGFTTVTRVPYGESEHEMLRDIETHGRNVNNIPMAVAETILFEAS